MDQIKPGDVIEEKSQEGLTYKVLRYDPSKNWIELEKLTRGVNDMNVFPVGAVLIEDQFDANQFKVVSVQTKTTIFRPEDFLPRKKQCDCGGMTVYKSEADHYHSSWCKINSKL